MHRSLPFLEALERRDCPSVTIQFDYRYDTRGFFNAPSRRAALQRAGDTLGSQLTDHLAAITPGGGNHWVASFPNPQSGAPINLRDLVVPADTLIVFVGARPLGGPIGIGGPGVGGPTGGNTAWADTVYARGQAGALLGRPTDFGPWGGFITFNPNIPWHFGVSPAGIGNRSDFYTTALHELTHLLGFGTTSSFLRYLSRGRFTGPNAIEAYNRPGSVPLGNSGHWAQSVRDDGRIPVMTPSSLVGTRSTMTGLDWAALEDLGWTLPRPTVTSVGPVNPDPAVAPVRSVEVVLSAPIRLTSFTFADLRLTRDGGPNLITRRVTSSHVAGTTYRIAGLDGLAGPVGSYQLTVSARGLSSPVGFTGRGSMSVTWAQGDLPPVARDDIVTVPVGGRGVFRVLANDVEPNRQPLQLSLIAPAPGHGTAVINDNRTPGDPRDDYVVYTPAPGYHGVDSFAYRITDDTGHASTAMVRVGVTRRPVARGESVVKVPGAVVRINALANDTDADRDPLQLSVTTPPARGTVTVDDNGTPGTLSDDFLLYTPDPGAHDPDSFVYQVDDGHGGTATARVRVTFRGVGLETDPADPTKKSLVVVGTAAADRITVQPGAVAGTLRATLVSGGWIISQGTFEPAATGIARVIVYAQAGNDTVRVQSGVPAIVLGGSGNDVLGSGGGRDLLFGGRGADTLRGGDGDDVLVGDPLTHEASLTALLALLAEWGRGDADYPTRAARLTGTAGGLNEPTYLEAATGVNDNAIDQLFGGGDSDLFVVRTTGTRKDRARDAVVGEIISLL